MHKRITAVMRPRLDTIERGNVDGIIEPPGALDQCSALGRTDWMMMKRSYPRYLFNRASPGALHLTKLGDGKIADFFMIWSFFSKSLDVNLRMSLFERQDLEAYRLSFDTTLIVSNST